MPFCMHSALFCILTLPYTQIRYPIICGHRKNILNYYYYWSILIVTLVHVHMIFNWYFLMSGRVYGLMAIRVSFVGIRK